MAEVSDKQVRRFRNDVGDTKTPPIFDIVTIEDYFDRATEDYPQISDNGRTNYAVILGLEWLIAEYTTQVNFTENTVSENLTDIRKGYEGKLARYQARLDKELADLAAADAAAVDPIVPVGWGSTFVSPPREEEYPDA